MSSSTWSTEELLGAVGAPTDWRTLPAETAAEAWDELREWVHWFKDRYALDHRVVPPCWYLHGALVDVLTALRDHHAHAFSDVQPATAASEWHRVFRDLEPRLRDWASRTGCTRTEHREDATTQWPDDDTRWRDHLNQDEQQRAAAEQAQALEEP
ncbi:MAG TPA: hypothetical protein VFH54_19995 [Mycobacteriales bacterium]|nr:hypothetical protein [Mycobacteriales bacterium]